MNRRRRQPREIGFSFDSFLDVVANVVGIIIRLILVVWVSARSYSSLKVSPPPAATATPQAQIQQQEPHDALADELAQHRRQLAEVQARLLEQLRQLGQLQQATTSPAEQLSALAEHRRQLEGERQKLEQQTPNTEGERQAIALSLDELRQRCGQIDKDIQALEKLPPARQTLHYQTPISAPIHSEELFFECRQGRVTFIDIAALLEDVRHGLQEKGEELRSRWEVSGLAGPVGAFQLRYRLVRERAPLDATLGGDTPNPQSGYQCGLAGWEVEPVNLERGEAEAAALKAGSEFRQIVDPLDPQQMTVTFWVYPDSFALYRRLRDYLYERGIVVAGRPLPDGVAIASSRHGTASRGQ